MSEHASAQLPFWATAATWWWKMTHFFTRYLWRTQWQGVRGKYFWPPISYKESNSYFTRHEKNLHTGKFHIKCLRTFSTTVYQEVSIVLFFPCLDHWPSKLFSSFYLICLHVLWFSKLYFFSSPFSGIHSLICFTNCPRALWCFTLMRLFFCHPLVHTKKHFLRKHLKRPRIHQSYVSSYFFFPPLNFRVTCFQYPAFLMVTL